LLFPLVAEAIRRANSVGFPDDLDPERGNVLEVQRIEVTPDGDQFLVRFVGQEHYLVWWGSYLEATRWNPAEGPELDRTEPVPWEAALRTDEGLDDLCRTSWWDGAFGDLCEEKGAQAICLSQRWTLAVATKEGERQ